MPISSGGINKDATLSSTGGTAQAFTSLGNDNTSRRCYFDGSNLLSRSEVDFVVREPKPKADAPSGYTQGRAIATVKVPKTLANGNTTINTLKIELSCDVETTDAEKDTLLKYGAELQFDSDFQNFWKALSIE